MYEIDIMYVKYQLFSSKYLDNFDLVGIVR